MQAKGDRHFFTVRLLATLQSALKHVWTAYGTTYLLFAVFENFSAEIIEYVTSGKRDLNYIIFKDCKFAVSVAIWIINELFIHVFNGGFKIAEYWDVHFRKIILLEGTCYSTFLSFS